MYICNVIREAYKFKICTAKTKATTFYRSEHMRAKRITDKQVNERTKLKKKTI
jgi:hypothetical protein